MPYLRFKRGKKHCTKNKNTGKVRCYSSESKRETGIKMACAFRHGFKTTRK